MEGRCRKHPQHKQSKGVCPYCLIEKLYHLSNSLPQTTAVDSAETSPAHSAGSDRGSCALAEASEAPQKLRKSRSLAVGTGKLEEGVKALEEGKKEMENMKKKRKKKGSFWSKFVVGSERREGGGGMLHSKTLKERPAAKWVIF